MDYKLLLTKYIRFIRECEGIDFIDSRRTEVDVVFEDAEWEELERLSAETSKTDGIRG